MATLGSQSEAWPSHEGVRPSAPAKISWAYVTYQPGICHVKSFAERAGGLTVTKEPTKWFRYVIVLNWASEKRLPRSSRGLQRDRVTPGAT